MAQHEMSRQPGSKRSERERGVWVRKFSTFEEENRADFEYWQRMTPDERVAIVEQLREEWRERNGDGDQGLPRITRVFARV